MATWVFLLYTHFPFKTPNISKLCPNQCRFEEKQMKSIERLFTWFALATAFISLQVLQIVANWFGMFSLEV